MLAQCWREIPSKRPTADTALKQLKIVKATLTTKSHKKKSEKKSTTTTVENPPNKLAESV